MTFSVSDLGLFWLSENDRAINGSVELLMGLFLFFSSKKLSNIIVNKEKELSLKEESLYDIAQITLKVLLSLALLEQMCSLIVLIILFLAVSDDAKDYFLFVPPVFFTIITTILLLNTKNIISRIIK